MTTLRYVDELLASFPDNTSGLISAVTQRDHVISTTKGTAFLEDDTPVVVPITDGVPTIVNPLLLAPVKTDQLWLFDANNLATHNYGAVTGLTIPPGYTKLVSFVGVLSLQKVAGGADTYSISFTKNGVLVGLDEFISFPAAGVEVVTVLYATLTQLDLNDTYGVAITGQGTSDDLTLHTFEMRLNDDILLTAPGP